MPRNYTVKDIPGWLSDNEGALLSHFAGKLPPDAVVVEIGSFHGKSTVYMAQALKSGKIYAIDPHLGKTLKNKPAGKPTYQAFLNNIKKFAVEDKIIPIRKTSLDANKGWKKKIDLLHIDGLHEYKFAKQDLKLWLPFLKNGGVVVCHDAFAPYFEVFKAVKGEIFNNKKFGYIGINDSQIFAVKGGKPNWQRPFIILASNIWHTEIIPYSIREFIVKRILKPFYLNKFMINGILKRWQKRIKEVFS